MAKNRVGWMKNAANGSRWEFQRRSGRRRVGTTGAAAESHGGRNGATGMRSGGGTRCSRRESRAAERDEGDPTGDFLHGGRFFPAIDGDVAEGGMPSGQEEGGTVVVAGLGLKEDGRA